MDMESTIENALDKVASDYDHDPNRFKEFCEVIFDMNKSGVSRDKLIDYLSDRYNSQELSAGQENIIDDFLTRISGWCTPGKEIFWPD